MIMILNNVYMLFAIAITSNIIALSQLPASAGYTKLIPTLVIIIGINFTMYLMAKITSNGMQLGVLVSLAAVSVPLINIFVGYFVYNEHSSFIKIVLLIIACILVLICSRIK